MFKSGKKSLRDQVEDLTDKITPAVESAIDQIGPLLSEARDKAKETAGPVIADARDAASPYVAQARDKVTHEWVPAAGAAASAVAATAAEKSGPDVEEVKRRGLATSAALKGEVDEPKKGGRLKKALIATGVIGLGVFIFKRLTSHDDAEWQSSYTPPAPASPAPPADEPADQPVADDAAGASPDESLSDAAAESQEHEVTTPDAPAEETDVSEEPDPKP